MFLSRLVCLDKGLEPLRKFYKGLNSFVGELTAELVLVVGGVGDGPFPGRETRVEGRLAQ